MSLPGPEAFLQELDKKLREGLGSTQLADPKKAWRFGKST
jgi:hypothetical protein